MDDLDLKTHEPRVRSVARVATTALTLTCLLLPRPALARLGRIHLAPVQAQAVSEMPPSGHRFEYCPGAPFIWEVSIENLGPSATTVQYDDKTMLDKRALPGSYTAPVLNLLELTTGSYTDAGPSPSPATAYHYEVYGRDCAGTSIIP